MWEENYKIPDEIKDQIPDYFYLAMWGELVSIFGKTCMEKDDDCENLYMLTSTGGWYAALRATCAKLDIGWLTEYWGGLDWYDSDRFDGEIAEELINHLPELDSGANSYYKFLIRKKD